MSARLRIGGLTLDTGRRLGAWGSEPRARGAPAPPIALAPGRRLVLWASKPVALGPLTYQLLLALVAAAPNVVTHDELARSVWGGRSVSPETISQRIKLLRDALADDPHDPRYVELVRGEGYPTLAG